MATTPHVACMPLVHLPVVLSSVHCQMRRTWRRSSERVVLGRLVDSAVLLALTWQPMRMRGSWRCRRRSSYERQERVSGGTSIWTPHMTPKRTSFFGPHFVRSYPHGRKAEIVRVRRETCPIDRLIHR